MTAPLPPTAPLSVRVGARIGPEVVGALLAGVVILAGVAFVAFVPRSQPGIIAVPPGSSASPQETATATPPNVTPEPAATKPVLEIVDRLLEERAALAGQVAARNPDVQTIAGHLRAINTGLVNLDALLPALDREGFTDLANRLHESVDATRDAVTDTLRASISNRRAYVAGGKNVVKVMEPLIAARADLAVVAGTP